MCGIAVYTGSDEKIKKQIEIDFQKIQYRGPDNTHIVDLKEKGWLGFHRLKIMDTTDNGNQPLIFEHVYLLTNGEVYNFPQLVERYKNSYSFVSHSDCESIIPLYLDKGIKQMAYELDAEYASVIYDAKIGKYLAARDPIGIRPLFYGYTPAGDIAFASELKVLHTICVEVKPFPPGHYYDGEQILPYRDIAHVDKFADNHTIEDVFKNIRELLIKGVEKRLHADVPLGFLLSGGLDSSLVCSIAQKILGKQIKTFAIGIEDGPIDLKYAKVVADYLGTEHTEVLFSKKDIFNTLDQLIFNLETWDITTVRASMGMYLLCQAILKNTDVKVLMTGEIADEIFGYKYTDFAPDGDAFQKEAQKRLTEIYLYDVLRADRSISSSSIEARVPFGDLDFVSYVMSIPPKYKINTTGVGKYLLRKAFDDGTFLPHEILFRDKAAFSDAVGHSMVDYLKEFAEKKYTDAEFSYAQQKYQYGTPISKESLLYRDIFEKHFPGRAEVIPTFWMPNKEWNNCNVDDPSARVLPNYGKSGM